MAISYSESLALLNAGVLAPNTGVWVQFVSNNTGTAYVSDSFTDTKGNFTYTTKPPGDTYTVNTGPTNTGPWTLFKSNWAVPVVQGENPAFQSGTFQPTSPYAPTAGAGGSDFYAGVRMGSGPYFDITHPRFGGKADNGVTDNGVAINAAINACNAAGGGKVFIPGNTVAFGCTTPIVPKSHVLLGGDGTDASILKWFGATGTTMINSGDPGVGNNILDADFTDFTLDGANTNNVGGILLNSWQFSHISNVWIRNLSGSGMVGLRMESASGTGAQNNTMGNIIERLRLSSMPVGIQLTGGVFGASAGVTNNHFHDVYMYDSTGGNGISQKGIRFLSSCDSNIFDYVEILLAANNAIGVILNDTATPLADTGCFNTRFFHLDVSAFSLTGCTGIKLNYSNQTKIEDFFHSPQLFPGTLVDTTNFGGNTTSAIIHFGQDNKAQNNQLSSSINNFIDTAGTLPQTADNSVAFSASLTGADPAVGVIGIDAVRNLQVNAKSTGGIYLNAQRTNFLLATGANTLGAPGLAAAGNDTNVDMALGAQGTGRVVASAPLTYLKDLRRSTQSPTETVLVSGVDATAGEIIRVTLTAARVVGLPLNPFSGQNLTFEFTQGGVGAFAVTWNAVFKKTWADTGNATGKISSITFYYNGTNWVQTGAQAPYV